MVKTEYILEAIDFLISKPDWRPVIAAAKPYNFDGTFGDFLSDCTACGGNWGGMILTGIKKLFPAVWDAIPEDMGDNAFIHLSYTLILCGVDTISD